MKIFEVSIEIVRKEISDSSKIGVQGKGLP